MSRTHYDKGVPELVRAELERFLPDLEWLIPDWCHRINVYWKDADGEGGDAEVFTLHEYRYADVTFYAKWLEGDDRAKRQTVAHELLHVVTNPLMRYVRETFEETLKDDEPKLFEHIKAHSTRHYEAVVEDLAYLIMGKLK